MRISDWSSDVCSSDLGVPVMLGVSMLPKPQARRFAIYGTIIFVALLFLVPLIGTAVNGAQRWIGSGAFRLQPSEFLKPFRSEERRVGKACVSTGRSRRSPAH